MLGFQVQEGESKPYDHVTQEQLEQVLKKFQGLTMQVPPKFSAIRVDGQRAYIKAKKGEDVS